MTTTQAAAETQRLKSLTESGEPKTAAKRAVILERVERIRDHADERCAFYAAGNIHEAAEAWSELAVDAGYRAEQIIADTWAWA